MNSLFFLSPLNQITWETYFARFFLVSWFLIFPILFMCVFLFILELDKNKKISVVFSVWKQFRHYVYFFHNLFFLFMIGAFSFNTIFLIYSFIDIYIVKISVFYSFIFRLEDEIRNVVPEENEIGFFWGVVFLGYFLNLTSFSTYFYHNLYRTNSMFAELWKEFVIRNKSHPYILLIRNKYPKFYSILYSWFLNVKDISIDSGGSEKIFFIS